MNKSVSGGCYCGAVQCQVTLPVKGVLHCHCSMCRRLSGAGYSTWASVPKPQFQFVAGEKFLSAFAVSANSTRYFCSICGTAVQTLDARYPKIVGVLLGTLAGDVEQSPSVHAFFDSKAPWAGVGDGLPCLGGVSGFEPLT